MIRELRAIKSLFHQRKLSKREFLICKAFEKEAKKDEPENKGAEGGKAGS